MGYGGGDAVADGRFAEALELPRAGRAAGQAVDGGARGALRGAAGAREPQLVAEELVLRARADLNAGRPREAALQARVALEALERLAEHRDAVGARRQRGALAESSSGAELQALTEAIKGMEAALRRHRLGG